MATSPLVRRQRRGLVIALLSLAALGLVPEYVVDPPPLTRDIDCSSAVQVGEHLWCGERAPRDTASVCRQMGLSALGGARSLHPGDAVNPIPVCLQGREPGRMAPAVLAALSLPVDVNAASERELSSLPGVGPVTARAIVAARPFSSVDGLIRVKGIGPKRLAGLRERARVGDETEEKFQR